jgi:hypothetical protein
VLESRRLIAGGTEAPLFEGGLVPTADGLGWERTDRAPATAAAAVVASI